jgi:tetratricopeptide (TPR) repeat protein
VGAYWNTLGLAHYRAGDYRAALSALEKAAELYPQGDGSDSLFLAMACWRLGQKAEAHSWYKRATEEFGRDHISAAELADLREEAADLLGLDLSPSLLSLAIARARSPATPPAGGAEALTS